ncbi:MAG: hypothetical protein ABH833_01705 [Parcubacteria group bacterium]
MPIPGELMEPNGNNLEKIPVRKAEIELRVLKEIFETKIGSEDGLRLADLKDFMDILLSILSPNEMVKKGKCIKLTREDYNAFKRHIEPILEMLLRRQPEILSKHIGSTVITDGFNALFKKLRSITDNGRLPAIAPCGFTDMEIPEWGDL